MREPIPGPTSLSAFEALLQQSDQKLELVEGQVLAFAGGSVAHGILCTRLVSSIAAVTKPPCHAFTSDVALRLAERATHVFPDVSHTCEALDPSAAHIVAPDLVVEVISPESKSRDRGEKLDAYQSLPSVMEYVLVDSRRVWISVFRRMAAGVWTETTYGPGEQVELRTVGLTLDVNELYAGTGRILST